MFRPPASAAAENRAGLFLRRLLRCGRSAGLLRTLRRQDDMLIHIGQISGDYASMGLAGCAKSVWRVAPDGELHDTFKKLDCLFSVEEQKFFEYYSAQKQNGENNSYLSECQEVYKKLYDKIPQELPFSNIWVAKRLYQELPQNSFIQLGILNSLRSWNLFDSKSIVSESCNTGGFGIDGGVSSFIGA